MRATRQLGPRLSLALASRAQLQRALVSPIPLEFFGIPCDRRRPREVVAHGGNRAGIPVSGKAPFGIVAGLSILALAAAVASAVAGEKIQKRSVILPPADASAERLQAQPRVPVEAVPLSGSVSPHAATDTVPRASPHACAGSKVSLAECAELAARIDRFMSERRPRTAADATSAAAFCREGREPASRCAAFIAQIAAWLKTRQTAEAPPALAGSASNDR
jgi:hypothetical protein